MKFSKAAIVRLRNSAAQERDGVRRLNSRLASRILLSYFNVHFAYFSKIFDALALPSLLMLNLKDWLPLDYVPQQAALWHTKARFVCVVASRQSGKSLLCFRKIILEALRRQGRYIYVLPTINQARKVCWKRMLVIRDANFPLVCFPLPIAMIKNV